ncbi:CYFIP-related Rac1 interactor B [Frankliniella fusca]|uniref:CYFIP-related Rac1 interactor B n=1 Tax=Frankliniella fusca TaxID=407009 RepID=A0AAE1H4X7_9NEOP|nr:CYFIP-related Rac1 interactor B [Frankliniella fusca]
MCQGYRELLQSFMKPNYLSRTDLSAVDPCKQDEYTPLANVYLGVGVMDQLKHPALVNDPAKVETLKRSCWGYLVELCRGIKQCYDFDDPLLKALPVLKASTSTSFTARSFSNSLLPFMDLVPRAKPADVDTVQRIDDQWRALPYEDIPQDMLDEELLDVFWARIGKITHPEGTPKFKDLSDFVLDVLSLPHSNADVKRIFSKITLIRTKLRNKLVSHTVEGLCLASQCVKLNGKCCCEFEPSQEMYKAMSSSTLYQREKGPQPQNAGIDALMSTEGDEPYEEEPDDFWFGMP